MLSVALPDDDETLNSLVLPTYNAGGQIHATLETLERFLLRSQRHWEVLFVCDGCTDGTERILQNWCEERDADARTIAIPKNHGKGYAVRVGMSEARGNFRVFTDVDLAYGIEEVCKVVDALRQGAEVAIASRTCPESELLIPADMIGYVFARKLQSSVFSAVVRAVLGIPFRDTQAGLKGMTAAAADQLLPKLVCDGFEFDCEWLAAANRLGLRIAEVPVRVRYEHGVGSTTNMGSMVRMLRGLLKIRQRVRLIEPTPLPKPIDQSRRAAA